jgi:hypothetical protein
MISKEIVASLTVMQKRIFVGVHFADAYFYLAGLNDLFQFVFFEAFHIDDLSSMHQFMRTLKQSYFTYRLPYFSCFFKKFSYPRYYSNIQIETQVRLLGYRHAIFYLGYAQQLHHYEVAFISEFDFQEQLQILGACADLIQLIEIDHFAIQLAQKQVQYFDYDLSPWCLTKALAIRGFYEAL